MTKLNCSWLDLFVLPRYRQYNVNDLAKMTLKGNSSNEYPNND